jgi:hypothetical protein
MAKQVSDKNTKTEILDAYKELANALQALAKDKKAMETEIARLSKQVSVAQNNANQAAASLQLHTAQAFVPANMAVVIPQNEKYEVEDIIKVFENIKEGFGNAGSNLSGKLTKEAGELAEIQGQIAEVEAAIKELHSIEIIDDNTLAQLVNEYEDKSKFFEKSYKEQEENMSRTWAEVQKVWGKETEDYELQLRERNNNLVKERKRENDEYNYKNEQERKQAKDVVEQQKKKLYSGLEDLKKEKQKELSEKENLLLEREKTYNETKAKAEELPEKLEKELKKVREETKGAIRRDAEIKANLLAKESEGQRKLNDLKIKYLEENVAKQQEQMLLLRTQLAETLKQAKDLAVKAIEGTSNGKSFDAMREIALEQAKQQKQK